MRAGPVFNARLIGCLAKAQALYDVDVHGFVALSNHWHLYATFRDPEQMARFHCHFTTNVSKEVSRLHDWSGSVFPERYRHVEISDEPEAQAARLQYLLSQGCKEGLVASPLDWPGVSSTWALIGAEPMAGEWVDRVALQEALGRGEEVTEQDFVERLEVRLTPPPALAHLSPEVYRQLMIDWVRRIEQDTAAMHRTAGTGPVGAEAVMARDPTDRPSEVERTPCPWVHARSKEVRDGILAALRLITAAYREAADRLKRGDRQVRFPVHTFPPGLPFVRSLAPTDEIELLEPG